MSDHTKSECFRWSKQVHFDGPFAVAMEQAHVDACSSGQEIIVSRDDGKTWTVYPNGSIYENEATIEELARCKGGCIH